MAKEDYYALLGVKKTAGDAELKSAYRKLASNITRMSIRATPRLNANSNRSPKPMTF